MNLERILAENMLRFGVKNLTDAAKSKLNEQAKPSIRQEAQNAASAGLPIVWVKNFEETKNVLNTIPVSAQFYNNMVTMETGMLPAGKKAFTDGLATAAQNILSANPDTVRITITGQATNLAPKKQGYNWATKQTMPLDHDYDKIDIEQNPQAGNIVLATKRAETAEKELVKLLGGKVPDLAKKITLKNKLVDGSLSADEQRKVIIEVSAATITQTPQWIDPTNLICNIHMTFGWVIPPKSISANAQIGIDHDLKPAFAYFITFYGSTNYPAGLLGDSAIKSQWTLAMKSRGVYEIATPFLQSGHIIDLNGKQAGSVGALGFDTALLGNQVQSNIPSTDDMKKLQSFIKSCGRFPNPSAFNNVFGQNSNIDGLLALVKKKAANAPGSWAEFTKQFTPKNVSDFTGVKTNVKIGATGTGGSAPVSTSVENKPKTTEKVIDVQVSFTYDELIDALGLNKNPVLDKTSTPLAYVIDKTVNPETTQKVSAMPTPPGDLTTNAKVLKTNR